MALKTLDRTNVFGMFEFYTGDLPVPDIIEFCVSDQYLNRPNLYPRQATLLKTVFLQTEIMTEYDYEVLEELAQGFHLPERQEGDDSPLRYEGTHGVQPDVLDRIQICRAEGRPWFREVVAAVGRRGSKGHLGAIAGAYVLWNYLARIDPHSYYGIDPAKRLSMMVFAAKKEQAKANQWRDLVSMIMGGPCFAPYLGKSLGESLSVYAPHDLVKLEEMRAQGIATEMDVASIEILPKESTSTAGRGPAAFCEYFDEFAHIVPATAKADSSVIYEAATPALDQFGVDAFLWEGSSTWTMTGQFYENWEQSLEVLTTPEGIVPARPEMLMFQLTSWDPYEDWERTRHQFPLRDGDDPIYAHPLKGAVQSYDDQLKRLERSNPEGFAVERRSHWAAALNAYLNPTNVAKMWLPWKGETLETQSRGILAETYRAHGDPSKSNDRFGWVIGHTERGDNGLLHVIFDVIHAWDPADYDDHQIDYLAVGEEIWEYIQNFLPESVTFDQWSSIATIQWLQHQVQSANLPKRVSVYEDPATNKLNWKLAETFKTALNLELLHGPYHEVANQEMIFLQDVGNRVDHPSSGPVTTKDVWDAMSRIVYAFLGEQIEEYIGKTLRQPPGLGLESGIDPFPTMRNGAHEALSRAGKVAASAARPGSRRPPMMSPSRGMGRPSRPGMGRPPRRRR